MPSDDTPMSDLHPDLETLARYVRGELGREPRRELERHLASCVSCQEKLEAVPAIPGAEPVVKWRAHVFEERRRKREAAGDARRDHEQKMGGIGTILGVLAEKQARDLLASSEHERRLLIRTDENYRTLALCELLEARCRSAWLDDPEEAVEYARLAVQVTERLDIGHYGADRVEKARAMAWMHLGNAYRIASEWRRSREEMIDVAEVAPEGENDWGGAASSLYVPPLPDVPRFEVETALWEMRDAFLERGMGFDAVLVSLDLAAAFLRDGRQEDFRRMVEEGVACFEASGVQPYTVDAMRFLREVLHRGEPEVTPDLLEKMAATLQRVRNDPQHRWQS
ncbi:MAG TPA: zf-HC2 domain-containing protein [Thermoanaerobaculia bacterium]|nr:zf-HC2 domain-containing protein [Thermoanaerobaculia bacterium]